MRWFMQMGQRKAGPTLREKPVLDAEVAGQGALMVRNLDWNEEEIIVHLSFILASHNDWLLHPRFLQPRPTLS